MSAGGGGGAGARTARLPHTVEAPQARGPVDGPAAGLPTLPPLAAAGGDGAALGAHVALRQRAYSGLVLALQAVRGRQVPFWPLWKGLDLLSLGQLLEGYGAVAGACARGGRGAVAAWLDGATAGREALQAGAPTVAHASGIGGDAAV